MFSWIVLSVPRLRRIARLRSTCCVRLENYSPVIKEWNPLWYYKSLGTTKANDLANLSNF